MSQAARILDLDAFRRRRDAARDASPGASRDAGGSAEPSALPAGAVPGIPAHMHLAPAVGWSTVPVAWAPMYVWMPVLMVLG